MTINAQPLTVNLVIFQHLVNPLSLSVIRYSKLNNALHKVMEYSFIVMFHRDFLFVGNNFRQKIGFKQIGLFLNIEKNHFNLFFSD